MPRPERSEQFANVRAFIHHCINNDRTCTIGVLRLNTYTRRLGMADLDTEKWLTGYKPNEQFEWREIKDPLRLFEMAAEAVPDPNERNLILAAITLFSLGDDFKLD